MARSLPTWLRLLGAALFLASGACVHITHPAEVRPGFELDVVAGAGAVLTRNHEEVLEPLRDVQVNFRYGWRYTEDYGFQLSVMVPLVYREEPGENRLSFFSIYQTGVDSYFQLGQAPDWGLGVVGGGMPRFYGMLGHGWDLGPQSSFRIDGSFGVGALFAMYELPTPTLTPSVSMRFELSAWDIGLWADGAVIPFGYCDGEFCGSKEGAFLYFTGGGFIGLRFSDVPSFEVDVGEDRWP